MKHLLTHGNLTGLMLVCIGMNLVGCATAPPVQSNSYVVLLPNDDGSVGKVQVTGRKGVTTLDKALDSARIASAGSPGILATEGQIKQDFGAAIGLCLN
jgi:peptidoglycan-associated lipoprotein